MISMTSWKNRLRRMLFLDELEPLAGQTQKVADFGSKSATSNAPSADAGNEREMYDARSHLDEVISHIRSPRDNWFIAQLLLPEITPEIP